MIHTWDTRLYSSMSTPLPPCFFLALLEYWHPHWPHDFQHWQEKAQMIEAWSCLQWTEWPVQLALCANSTCQSSGPVKTIRGGAGKGDLKLLCLHYKFIKHRVGILSAKNMKKVHCWFLPFSKHKSACWIICHSWALLCGCSETDSGQWKLHGQLPFWWRFSEKLPTLSCTAALVHQEYFLCSENKNMLLSFIYCNTEFWK